MSHYDFDDGNPYASPPLDADSGQYRWETWGKTVSKLDESAFSLEVREPEQFGTSQIYAWNFVQAWRMFLSVILSTALFLGFFGLVLFFQDRAPVLFWIFPVAFGLFAFYLWRFPFWSYLMLDDYVGKIAVTLQERNGHNFVSPGGQRPVVSQVTFQPRLSPAPFLDDADDVGYFLADAEGVRFVGDHTDLFIAWRAILAIRKSSSQFGSPALHFHLDQSCSGRVERVIVGIRSEKTYFADRRVRNELFELFELLIADRYAGSWSGNSPDTAWKT